MTTIIGVNHLAMIEGFTTHFSYPYITEDIVDYLRNSNVGLELLSPDVRAPLNNLFWKNNPDNIMTIFNPEAHKYFEDLEKICGKVTYLESGNRTKRLIEIDESYRHFSLEINSLEYKEPNDIDNSRLSSILVDHWKLYLEAIKIDVERDNMLLQNVLSSNLDVAVVGMGHAYFWMKAGVHPFEFLGEDVFSGVPLSHLNNSTTRFESKDFKYYDFVEKWQAQVIDPERKRQPDYIGLFEPFTPATYFEIFLDKPSLDGVVRGDCLDMYGHSIVEFRRIKDDFIMNKRYDYHTQGVPLEFEYSGIFDNNNISGIIMQHKPKIYTHGPFIMMENFGNAIDNLEKLYQNPSVLDGLKNIIPLGELHVPLRDFPLGVGNTKHNITTESESFGFNDTENLNHSREDDLPF